MKRKKIHFNTSEDTTIEIDGIINIYEFEIGKVIELGTGWLLADQGKWRIIAMSKKQLWLRRWRKEDGQTIA